MYPVFVGSSITQEGLHLIRVFFNLLFFVKYFKIDNQEKRTENRKITKDINDLVSIFNHLSV